MTISNPKALLIDLEKPGLPDLPAADEARAEMLRAQDWLIKPAK